MSNETTREQFLILRRRGADKWETAYLSQMLASMGDQPNPTQQDSADLYTNSFEYGNPTQYRRATEIIEQKVGKLNSEQLTDTNDVVPELATLEKELLDAGFKPELDLYKPETK